MNYQPKWKCTKNNEQSQINGILFQGHEFHSETMAAQEAAINAMLLALWSDSELMAKKLPLFLNLAAEMSKAQRRSSGEEIDEEWFDGAIAEFRLTLQNYRV